MAEEQRPNYLERMTMYTDGAVAGILAKDNPRMAHISLDSLIGKLPLDDATIGVLQSYMSTEKGIKDASAIYAGAYEKAKFGTTVEELSGRYDGILSSYVGEEDAAKIRGELAKFNSENYGKIMRKIEAAKHTLEGKDNPENGYTEDQIKSAEKTIKKYEIVENVLGLLEGSELEPYIANVKEEYKKRAFKSIAGGIESAPQEGQRAA